MSRVGADARAPYLSPPDPGHPTCVGLRGIPSRQGPLRARRFRADTTREPELPLVRIEHLESQDPRPVLFVDGLFKSSLSRFAAHPCRLARPGPAVQRGGPDSSCYLARGTCLSTRAASEEDASSLRTVITDVPPRAPANPSTPSLAPGPKARRSRGSAAFDDARRTSVVTCTASAPKRGERVSLGPWRALDRIRALRRLLPIVALSAAIGKRVPPLTLFRTRPTGRNPEERAERRATPAPSRATAAVDAPSAFHRRVERFTGLRRNRSCCRSRGFAASIRPPTLFRRTLP